MSHYQKSVCLVASCDLCYSPRLLKIGDSLAEQGFAIRGVDVRLQMGEKGVYEKVFQTRDWNINSISIDKSGLVGRMHWFRGALVQKMASVMCNLSIDFAKFYPYANLRYFNQLLQLAQSTKASIYICNHPFLLPIAAKAASQNGGLLWYDSQEYFRGMKDKSAQAATYFEDRFIYQADIVTSASRQIANKLVEIYPDITVFPLRNAPHYLDLDIVSDKNETRPLRIIWHGFSVNLYGRGVNIIIEAFSSMRNPAILTLQGFVSELAKETILIEAKKYNIENRIIFRKASAPDEIVASITEHDIGIASEPGLDENQKLTSSNKVFEYLMAGLAVVVSDMPGLIEVVTESSAGFFYPAQKAKCLAEILDRLAEDRDHLYELKKNARHAAKKRMNWSIEIEPVIHSIQTKYSI